MSSISDRLKSLGAATGSQDSKHHETQHISAVPIEELIAGEFWRNSSGEIFVVETNYKADFLHGSIKLKSSSKLGMIANYARAPQIADLDIEKFAFIDTETTGLGLGTGIYTFMVGVGRFIKDHFRLAQFFLRNPGEETAQLAAINEFLAPCEVWVSYNGKSFDIPLLNNRYVINGYPIPLKDAPHIDLLHLARRLWKSRLPSRTLGDLETQILGAKRSHQDVPGWMIPNLYFDYLKTGDARPLLGVFYHNELDIITLAALLARMADLLANPLNDSHAHGLDLAAVGKLYAEFGLMEEAVDIYQHALKYDDFPEDAFWQVLKELSFVYKKQMNIGKACKFWEQAAQNKQIYAHVELAKIHEHRLKDFPAAIYWTKDAINIVCSPDFPAYERDRLIPELEHRLKRLEKRNQKPKDDKAVNIEKTSDHNLSRNR